MKIVITFALWISLGLMADKSDELFGNNQEAISFIKSFQMNCTSSSPQCDERGEALEMEDRFNEIFSSALSRNIHIWPNNELLRVEEAFNLRKAADNYFSKQFFGKASDGYKEAAKIILETLEKADLTVEELIELGEEYLYEDGKPDWAAPYFNDAAPYDPENQRIINGLSRIRFLRSFEDDVKSIEDLLFARDFEQALSLIEETITGDPGNKTLEQLRVQATEGSNTIKLNILRVELNDENYSLTLEEKKEKLIKIENSISLYGKEQLGPKLTESTASLKDEIYQEELKKLEDEYINNPSEIETIYQRSRNLSRSYPSKKELQDLAGQITETRNRLKLEELKISAGKLISSEKWINAKSVFQEIYVVDKSDQTRKQIEDLEKMISLISKVEKINGNSSNFLKNQEYRDLARLVYRDLVVYSNQSTPKLNKDLVNFDNLINQYQMLVTESEKNNKSKQARNNRTKKSEPKSNRNSSTEDPSPTKTTRTSRSSQELQNFRKASLDMTSFSKSVSCSKRIRNKEFVAQYEISLSLQGKPKSILLINGDEINSDSKNTRQALKVIKAALMKSKYTPAMVRGVYVESVLPKRLAIPAEFCS